MWEERVICNHPHGVIKGCNTVYKVGLEVRGNYRLPIGSLRARRLHLFGNEHVSRQLARNAIFPLLTTNQ